MILEVDLVLAHGTKLLPLLGFVAPTLSDLELVKFMDPLPTLDALEINSAILLDPGPALLLEGPGSIHAASPG